MSRQTKPGNTERGWNDPPFLIYGTGEQTSTPPRKNLLSKRVAFPMNNNTVVNQASSFTPFTPNLSQPMQPVNILTNSIDPQQPSPLQHQWQPNLLNNPSSVHLFPPSNTTQPPQFHGPVIVPTMQQPTIFHPQPPPSQPPSIIPPNPSNKVVVAKDPMSDIPVPAVLDNDDLQVPSFHDDTQMFHYTTTRLQRSINDCIHTSEKHLLDEIEKKMLIFSNQWTSQRISYPVKSIMARLATAIHRRRCDVAEELQMSLVLDHITESSKWSVAVKRLIQEVEKVHNHPISPSVSCEEALASGASKESGSGGADVSGGSADVGGGNNSLLSSKSVVGDSSGVGSSSNVSVGSSGVVDSFTTVSKKDDGIGSNINSSNLTGNVGNIIANINSNILANIHPESPLIDNSRTDGGNVLWQGASSVLNENNVLLQHNVTSLTNQSSLLTSFHTSLPSNAMNITAPCVPEIQSAFVQPPTTLVAPTTLGSLTTITPTTLVTPAHVIPTHSNTGQNLNTYSNDSASFNKSHSTGNFFKNHHFGVQTSDNLVTDTLTSQDAASFFDNIASNISPDISRTSSFPFLAFNKTPATDTNKAIDNSVDKVDEFVANSAVKAQSNDFLNTSGNTKSNVDEEVVEVSDKIDKVSQEDEIEAASQEEKSGKILQKDESEIKTTLETTPPSTQPPSDISAVVTPLKLTESDKLTEIIQTTQDIVLNDDDDEDECKVTNTVDTNNDDGKDDFKTVDL